MSKLSLQALLAQLAEQQAEQDPTPPSFPHPLAQALELRARWKAKCEPEILLPGDLVQERAGMGMLKQDRKDKIILLIWRLLDMENDWDFYLVQRFLDKEPGIYGFDKFDCLVSHITSHGQFDIFPHQRNMLQLWDSEGLEKELN